MQGHDHNLPGRISAGGESAVRCSFAELNGQFFGYFLINRFISHDHTADVVANKDDISSDRFPVNPGIKSGNTFHLFGRHSKFGCNIRDRLIGDPSPVFLHNFQGVDAGCCRDRDKV